MQNKSGGCIYKVNSFLIYGAICTLSNLWHFINKFKQGNLNSNQELFISMKLLQSQKEKRKKNTQLHFFCSNQIHKFNEKLNQYATSFLQNEAKLTFITETWESRSYIQTSSHRTSSNSCPTSESSACWEHTETHLNLNQNGITSFFLANGGIESDQ